MTLIRLESVGTFIDPETGITYPANPDWAPDLESDLHLTEIVSAGWWEKLSAQDRAIIDLIDRALGITASGENLGGTF